MGPLTASDPAQNLSYFWILFEAEGDNELYGESFRLWWDVC